MEPSIKDQINARGSAVLQDHGIGMDTVAVAAAFGKPLTPWDGGLIQELVPRASATPNTYSGIYGLDRFPFIPISRIGVCRPPSYCSGA
jgi:L-asparagine oxygenase